MPEMKIAAPHQVLLTADKFPAGPLKNVLKLWAPKANQVEIQIEDHCIPLTKRNHGWWSAEDLSIDHGMLYSFRINSQGPFPDPRSCFQPKGIHGPSQLIDHSRFHWTDLDWHPPPFKSGYVYEMHVGTFTPEGTFDAVIDRLEHLVHLGITHIQLMPVVEFSGERGWGYDGVFLYAPHHIYGGPDGLKRLVNACHNKGLAVLLDVVYNHLGPVGNYLEYYGHYFTDRYATPWGPAVNLDGPHSMEVRKFFIDNALMWLRDYHFDGLRLDATHAMIDTSAIHFLEELSSEVKKIEKQLKRPLLLIAENDLNDSKILKPISEGGYGIDGQWNEDFHHALHAVLTGEKEGYYQDFGAIAHVAKVLTKGLVYDGCHSSYRKKKHGRPIDGISPHQYVAFLQNHDQVGNRPLGTRISHLLSKEQMKLGAAFLFTSPFIPMLFQGEEWGATTPFLYFTDHKEPELGEAVREGRKKEFSDFLTLEEQIPCPQSEETFKQSKLRWEELQSPFHKEILTWHHQLIQLRRQQKDLNNPDWKNIHVDFDETQRWLCMKRGKLVVAFNFSEGASSLPIKNIADKNLLLASHSDISIQAGSLYLPAYAAAIFQDL